MEVKARCYLRTWKYNIGGPSVVGQCFGMVINVPLSQANSEHSSGLMSVVKALKADDF